jgi:putative NIF3 family GTP cyclohydrolase 1 type 2
MDLKLVVKRLEEFAPLNTATDWDNVGLLVEPSDPLTVTKVLVTNDLSEPVIEEAKKKNGIL